MHRILVALTRRATGLNTKPREFSTLGLFAPYDGNLIGGLLLGTGMALSGSCPGTVFSQIGASIDSGLYTLAGCVLGGVVWSGVLQPIVRSRTRRAKEKAAAEAQTQSQPAKLAIYELAGISRQAASAGVTAMFAAAVGAIEFLAPSLDQAGQLVTPIQGGILVASSQLVSIFSRTKLLGTSTCFEEVGAYISSTLGLETAKPTSYGATILTTGMVLGSFLVSSFVAESSPAPVAGGAIIQPARAVLGGVLLAVGSRMGGGCTSGHGLSGMALLSISSFVTVAAMFGGGMAVAALLGL